jgi:hypothetical protein
MLRSRTRKRRQREVKRCIAQFIPPQPISRDCGVDRHPCDRRSGMIREHFQEVQTFIRGRPFELGIVVRRICNFTIKATSVSDQNRASGSISSCTTRINLPALSYTSDTRHVSICYGITGRVLPDQVSVWHPWDTRLRIAVVAGGCAAKSCDQPITANG